MSSHDRVWLESEKPYISSERMTIRTGEQREEVRGMYNEPFRRYGFADTINLD